MPAGQAHTTWFPELKDILKNKWNSNYSIEQHFSLVTDLNEKLRQIRKELNIQPPYDVVSELPKTTSLKI